MVILLSLGNDITRRIVFPYKMPAAGSGRSNALSWFVMSLIINDIAW